VVVVFDELTQEDLVEILQNPNNPIILSKRQDFRAYDIDIKFEQEALSKIAEMATKEKTGARGLVSAIEKVLIPFEKHLPSTDVKEFLVTPDVVENPERELKALMESYSDPERFQRFETCAKKELENVKVFIKERAHNFEQISGLDLCDSRLELIAALYLKRNTDINTAFDDFLDMYRQVKMEEASLFGELELSVTFEEDAVDELIRRAIDSDEQASSLTFQLGKKLEYGLKLVRDRSGVDHFTISRDAVTNMENYINALVKRYYRKEYDPYVTDPEEDH
jgi:hypothetical protein